MGWSGWRCADGDGAVFGGCRSGRDDMGRLRGECPALPCGRTGRVQCGLCADFFVDDGGVFRLFFPDGFVCGIAEYADDVAVIIEHAGHVFGLVHSQDVFFAEACGLGGFFQCDGGWLGLAAVAFALEAQFVVERPEQEYAYEAAYPRKEARDEVLDCQ